MKTLGHRGAIQDGNAPYQNSLEAFELALKHCDGIETDACISADGEVFLIHDEAGAEHSLDEHLNAESRKYAAGRRLDQMHSGEIAKLRLPSDASIPTLHQVIELFSKNPDKILNIELKGYNVCSPVLDILREAFKNNRLRQEQIIISSFNHHALADARRAMPSIAIGMLFIGSKQASTPIFPETDNIESCYQPINSETLDSDLFAEIKPQHIIISHTTASDEIFRLIEEKYPDTKVAVWVHAEAASFDVVAFNHMIEAHIDVLSAVIVDNPDTFTTTLEIYDIAIIGGGINGCGIARDAAGRGLKILLCEQGDLGGATSSNSTKLIHGGLRYLEHYEFGMVRKALQEREKLLKIAPHIIHPLNFILPHQPHLRPRWLIKAGLFFYDLLTFPSKMKKSSSLNLAGNPLGEPLKDSFSHAFTYSDCQTDDNRLVILNAIDAQNHGALIKPYTKCIKAVAENNMWTLTLKGLEKEKNVQAKILLNATGPWAQSFIENALETPSCKLRLVKGSHIVVPKIFNHDHAYILQNADNRIIFAIPYQEDFTLIGTTDEEFNGDPAKATCDADAVEYLCNSVNEYFKTPVKPDDVVWSYAGVRPLMDDENTGVANMNVANTSVKNVNASKVTRDYKIELDTSHKPPLLNIWGGKLTTYRLLAEDVMDKIADYFPHNKPWTATQPLPGGDIPQNKDYEDILYQKYPWLPKQLAMRYARSYGTLVEKILGDSSSLEDLGKHFGADLYQAELDYLIENEWATDAEAILWRRSKLGVKLSKSQQQAVAEYIL